MHFHLPKPLHGWREFTGEVGIIVIGVLIALGAEQVVERASWQRHVAEARDALRTELEGDLFNAQERVRIRDCVDRRLDQLSELIDDPPPRPWKLLPGGNVVPIRVWSSSSWDSAVADGAVAHMPRDERAQYANIYSFVRGLHAMVLEEYPISVEFRMLEHGGPISEATQDRLRADIAKVRGYNFLLAVGSEQISHQIRALGVGLSAESQRRLDADTCRMPRDTLPAASG